MGTGGSGSVRFMWRGVIFLFGVFRFKILVSVFFVVHYEQGGGVIAIMLYDENGQPVKSANQINSISNQDFDKIQDYLQGCVYTWCNKKGKEPFCAADFAGGTNYYWQGTPLFPLFSSRSEQYQREYPQENEEQLNERAVKQAGIDLGWILKSVLIKDKRTFTTHEGFHFAYYTWDGNTDNDTSE